MFENVSGKVKTVAHFTAILGIIASVIGGLFFMSREESFIIGLILAVIGSLFSWIIAIFLFGFGELLEKVGDIEENTRNSGNNFIDENPQNTDEDTTDENDNSNIITCPHCGKQLENYNSLIVICPWCNRRI